VAAFLRENAIENPMKVAMGTLWPRPDCHHIAISGENLGALADIVDKRGVSLPAIHMHAYREGAVFLQWHDAFLDDPMYLHPDIPEERVREFAAAVEGDYVMNTDFK
jgi:hypothetical protein